MALKCRDWMLSVFASTKAQEVRGCGVESEVLIYSRLLAVLL